MIGSGGLCAQLSRQRGRETNPPVLKLRLLNGLGDSCAGLSDYSLKSSVLKRLLVLIKCLASGLGVKRDLDAQVFCQVFGSVACAL